MMDWASLTGACAVVLLIAAVAVVAGRRVKTTQEFTVAGRRAGWPVVSGILVGALVGGSSTVGTAQAAYTYGLAAWWFTLGGGLGCLVLALWFARPFRAANIETLPHFLVSGFGKPIRPLVSVCDCIGVFMTIPGQAASAITLLSVVLHWPLVPSAVLVGVLVAAYVFGGGAISAGVAGFAKLLVAFASLTVLGIAAWLAEGGLPHFAADLPPRFLDLFGNGVWTDLGSGFGIIMGVLTTQVYVQAVITGRTIGAARTGTVVAGLGTILFGLGGVAVGLYMRIHEPNIRAAEALPLFAQHHFPSLVSGALIGAILVTVLTCAGGLALGITTMVTRDLYQPYLRPQMGDREGLRTARVVVICVVALGVVAGASGILKLIVNYSFLAFAFRADSILVPLLVTVFLPGSRFCTLPAGLGAVAGGMVANIAWTVSGALPGLAVFVGMAGSVLGLLAGSLVRRGSRGSHHMGITSQTALTRPSARR